MVDLGMMNVLPIGWPLLPPLLAQVNIGTNPASYLGLAFAIGGVGLFFLRNIRPSLARDYDIFFAAVGLLGGGILFFQAWRLEPLIQFQQFLMISTTAFFAYESIKLRGIATDQARKNAPVFEDERPMGGSRAPYSYRAELDDYEPLDEDRNPSRRIRGNFDRYEEDDYDRPQRRPAAPPSRRPRPALTEAEDDNAPRRRQIPPERDSGRDMGRDSGRDMGRDSGRDSDRPARSDRNSRSSERRPEAWEDWTGTSRSNADRPIERSGRPNDRPAGRGDRPGPRRGERPRPPLEDDFDDVPPSNAPGNPSGGRPGRGRPDPGPSDDEPRRPPRPNVPGDRPQRPLLDLDAPPPAGRRDRSAPPDGEAGEYVDFKPVRPPAPEDDDNSSNFDD